MMSMEILALIFAIAIIVKMLGFIFIPKQLMGFAEKIFKANQKLLVGLSVIAVVIVGYYVLSIVTIYKIAAAMLFGHLLMGMFLLQYPKEILALSKKVMQDKKKMWFMIIVYLALAGWILWGLFRPVVYVLE